MVHEKMQQQQQQQPIQNANAAQAIIIIKRGNKPCVCVCVCSDGIYLKVRMKRKRKIHNSPLPNIKYYFQFSISSFVENFTFNSVVFYQMANAYLALRGHWEWGKWNAKDEMNWDVECDSVLLVFVCCDGKIAPKCNAQCCELNG